MPDQPIKHTPTILFVGNQRSSFVKNDFEILGKHFPVTPLSLTQQGHPLRSLPRFILNTLIQTQRADLVYCWFANMESFLPVLLARIMKKQTIVVAGGYDCANEPSYYYGNFAHPLKRIIASSILTHADDVLAVSHFTEHEALSHTTPRHIHTVYNGVDTDKFRPSQPPRENLVVTVATVDALNTRIKGLRTFAQASRAFPDHQFTIIGPTEEPAKQDLLAINPCLRFLGAIPHDEIVPWFQRAKVYCQLSYRESFGLALAEAMSCGCIPVTTDRGALPEIVADQGFIVPYDDVTTTITALTSALREAGKNPVGPRQRILTTFSLKRREENLLSLIPHE